MKRFTPQQIELGSKIITVINMGQDQLLTPLATEKDVRVLWGKFLALVVQNEEDEHSMDEEQAYWAKQLQKRDTYSINTLQEYAPWLLEKK